MLVPPRVPHIDVIDVGDVNTSFKPLTTLRKVLVSPKDKTALEKQSGVIYSIKWKDWLFVLENQAISWKKV